MRRIWLFLFLPLLLVPLTLADETSDAEAPRTLNGANRLDISVSPYKFDLQGDLVRVLDQYRKAVNDAGIQPSRERQLRAELERLTQVLNSHGYYQAGIDSAYEPNQNKPKYQVRLNRRYRIDSIELSGSYVPANERWLRLKAGDPLVSVDVLEQETRLADYIADNHCFYNIEVSHQVRMNHEDATADLTFIANADTPASFGDISFTRDADEKPELLRRASGINSGDCFARDAIDNAVIGLFDTGIYAQVRPVVTLTAENNVDVRFEMTKRPIRTLSASVGWVTDIGPQTGLGWQHRDIFGQAQSLSIGAELSQVEQSLTTELVFPSFGDRRNRLVLDNELKREDIDIETFSVGSTATLERRASRTQYFEYGLGYSQIFERDSDETSWSNYRQIRLPLQYQFDSVRAPFNPRGGERLLLSLEPVWDIDENFTPFVLTGVGVQNFSSFDNNLTIASKLSWSSLWYGTWLGSTLQNVPASEWLTAGGSSSLRGYSYESIRLESGENFGGADQRWLISNELRLRLGDYWGLVAFWDVGSVSNELNPLRIDQWYDGIGAGVRYYTPFAPIRLDVAFPQDRRPQDGDFQIYVSLGQAF